MIECIFTVDYEIYGNGEGSMRELVYEPAERLRSIFRQKNARFVMFVEVAELEEIEAEGADPSIDLVKHQIREFHQGGIECGLHFHPWWYNARRKDGIWLLDYNEYNLCNLSEERIIQIVDRSMSYFRGLVGTIDFKPFSYRAGHLLFQPARILAKVLAERGIKVDSSVYKGGLHRQFSVDYRGALRNGYYWRFTDDANMADPEGALLELPIYTQMVPTWEMLTRKRIGLQRKGSSAARVGGRILHRFTDYLHFWHPLKFDFCHMTLREVTRLMDEIIRDDTRNPSAFRPIVAIGHTKDLVDFDTLEFLLSYLYEKGISVSTFADVYQRCKRDVDIRSYPG